VSQLDKILSVPNEKERLDQLVSYARALKLNFNKARKQNGQINEEELAVLIYDVEQNRRGNKNQQLAALAVYFFIFSAVLVAILLFQRIWAGLAGEAGSTANIVEEQ